MRIHVAVETTDGSEYTLTTQEPVRAEQFVRDFDTLDGHLHVTIAAEDSDACDLLAALVASDDEGAA